MILPNGSIKIIDRVKNLFKLSQGEYIAPEKLEKVYLQSPFISQIFVHGDPFNDNIVAICVVENDTVKEYLEQKNVFIRRGMIEPHLQNPDLNLAILQSFQTLAKQYDFSGLEKLRKFHLTAEPFTIESNILTPTMKIKRNVAKVAYSY